MFKTIDNLEGCKFGDWTVLRKVKPNTYGNTYWLVRCSCGAEREITGRTLIYNNSTHCGCQRTKKMTKHEYVGEGEIPSRKFKVVDRTPRKIRKRTC